MTIFLRTDVRLFSQHRRWPIWDSTTQGPHIEKLVSTAQRSTRPLPLSWSLGEGSCDPRGHCKDTGGPECPSRAGRCCKRGGVSITYPRQINKPVLRPSLCTSQRKEFAIKQPLSRAEDGEHSRKNKVIQDQLEKQVRLPSHKLRLHPQIHLPAILRTTAFAVQLWICYNIWFSLSWFHAT